MKVTVCWGFLTAVWLCAGERILYLAPVPSKSHFILSEPLVKELAERGHRVIMVTPFRMLRPVENVEEIVIPDVSEFFMGKTGNESDGGFDIRHKISSFYSSSDGAEALMNSTMTHQSVIDLLNSEEKIDLVVGISVSSEGLLAGFAHRLKAPMVIISTSVPGTSINEMVGNPAPSSYIPDGGLGLTDRMTFCQRLMNFILATFSQVNFHWLYLPQQESLMRKYFGDDVPPLEELLMNNSLVLVNHHFGLGFPRPNFPNMVEIGGYHVKPPKSLPEDLERFMEEAEDGVIYFSMGSSVRNGEFPSEKFQEVLNTFSNLTQRVLWKFDSDILPSVPENVRISKWLPQSDILAHPNLKLCIIHGGLLSLTEATFRGVPIIGIPIHPDQVVNVQNIENLHLGLRLDFENITEETLSSAIHQIIPNSSYSINARFRSKILQDRPVSPMDMAVYWLEYVMRYGGAPHLRSGAQHLAWYQLYQVDVLLFIGVLLLTGLFVMHKLCFWIFRSLRDAEFEEISFVRKNK